VPGQPSKGRVLAKTRHDLLEAAVVAKGMLAGDIEPFRAQENALDVLAQFIVGFSADGSRTAGQLYALARRAYSYRALPRGPFDDAKEHDFLIQQRVAFIVSKNSGGAATYPKIAAARSRADVVVVSVHWGIEYVNEPVPFQLVAAQLLLDLGADLVLGHHPHAVQGFLPTGRGLVAFSLGNFVFDQPWPQSQESMVLQVQLSSKGIFSWDWVPVQISACQPRVVAGYPEGDALLKKITDLSWDLYLRQLVMSFYVSHTAPAAGRD